MKKLYAMAASVLLAGALTGCTMTSGTDLGAVASSAGLSNVTTGDGTFENYKATNYTKATEIGIAVGIPFVGKFFEIFPAYSNEALLGEVAQDAKASGANAVINATPSQETYWGFPFFIIGLYVDHADGTGITTR